MNRTAGNPDAFSRGDQGFGLLDGDLRQQGEDAYKRCFTQRAPQQPSFVEATRQAEALLAAAIGK